jgi:hypothetical protein
MFFEVVMVEAIYSVEMYVLLTERLEKSFLETVLSLGL